MGKSLSFIASGLLALSLSSVAVAAEGIEGAGGQGEKSGVFIGVQGGVSLISMALYDEKGKAVSNALFKEGTGTNPMAASFNIGVKAGYQHFFMPMVGVRGYLGYNFNGSRTAYKLQGAKDTTISVQHITANVDALVNFLNTDSLTFGAYVGLGLGYAITSVSGEKLIVETLTKESNYSGFILPINIGIAATFAGNHKVEVGGTIQTLTPAYIDKTNKKSGIGASAHTIHVGYSYIF